MNNQFYEKLNNLISYDVLKVFLERSPIKQIYLKIKNLFLTSKSKIINIEYLHAENDAIGKFLKNIKTYDLKNKPHLFFIHNYAPHFPHIYNSDCSIRWSGELSGIGYKKNYLCMLKRINEITNYINLNDPEAIVVIQADHSIMPNFFPELNLESTLFTQYDIFNLIKVNKECEKYISNKIDQPNAIRLALACATNQKVRLLEKKSYRVYYEEEGDINRGDSFLIKEITKFEDELVR